MGETTDPAATEETQPADEPAPIGGDDLNGPLMADLRRDVEARLKPILNPEPEPDPRAATLSEEEQDYLSQRTAEYEQQLNDLELRNRILELGRERPQVASLAERVIAAQTFEELTEALSSAFAGPDPEEDVPDVDRNNPPGTPIASGDIADMIRLPDGRLITREQGIEMLRQADSLHA